MANSLRHRVDLSLTADDIRLLRTPPISGTLGHRTLQQPYLGEFAGPVGQLRATERVDQSFKVVELVEGET